MEETAVCQMTHSEPTGKVPHAPDDGRITEEMT